MTEHRWSGWPGAWCLDCGAEDAWEMCLADGHEPLFLDEEVLHCNNRPCPEPGSTRHDPYAVKQP